MNRLEQSFLGRMGRFAYRCAGISREHLFAQGFPAGICSPEKGNILIRDAIVRGDACMIGRLGFVEANAVLNHLEKMQSARGSWLAKMDASFRPFRDTWDKNLMLNLYENAGVFPMTIEAADQFSQIYLKKFASTDYLAAFGNIPGERYLHEEFCPKAISIPIESLEPFRFERPWSAMLEGKKILVIHPFAKSISNQYRNRKLLFQNSSVLPDFELKVLPAVQSIAGNPSGFGSWDDALKSMQEKMESEDFDICLVGAGAYGLPLSAHAKNLGKIAIHMGGATQILFGIRGARWEKFNKDVCSLFNEHWIRPDDSERPTGAHKIEEGCYW